MPKKTKRNQHKEKMNARKVRIITLTSFLLGFSGALVGYVSSYYFKEVTGTENVGLFYTVIYSIVLITLLNFHKLIRLLGRSQILYLFYVVGICSLFALIMIPPSFLGILFLMIYIISRSVSWVAIDVILEVFSEDRMSGRIRGLYLTVMNAGFLLGPFISTKMLDEFGFSAIFLLILIINSISFIIALVSLSRVNHAYKGKLDTIKALKKMLKRRNVMRIYLVSFTLEFFYAIMVIFMPLYLLSIGFSWIEIGKIFTVMLLPFVVLQYPVGLVADKKMGEKEMIIFALFVMGMATLMVYFNDSTSLFVWAMILLLTRIGASLVEILRDSYFYKRIDGDDVDIIDFFRTSRPAAYITASAISSAVIGIFSIKALFILLTIVIFSALYPAFRLVDNKCEDELKGCK